MKTYITLWFNSNGATPTEVEQKLSGIGFKSLHGNYDLVYEWDTKARMEDTLKLGDLIQKTLKGTNVLFKMETI